MLSFKRRLNTNLKLILVIIIIPGLECRWSYRGVQYHLRDTCSCGTSNFPPIINWAASCKLYRPRAVSWKLYRPRVVSWKLYHPVDLAGNFDYREGIMSYVSSGNSSNCVTQISSRTLCCLNLKRFQDDQVQECEIFAETEFRR